MILQADKIVYGEIEELDSLTFTFKINGNHTGTEKEIKVQRFNDWPCAQRWTDYEIGQKLFLFLKEYDGKYHSISAGNEGELPILNGFVYINANSIQSPPASWSQTLTDSICVEYGYLPSELYELHGETYFGYKENLDSFISTVETIRSCFIIKEEDYRNIKLVEYKCQNSFGESESEKNEILNWCYKKLIIKTGGNKK
jgi:hypothetical protein